MMTDHHHGKVNDHLMKPCGEEEEEEENEEPGSSPSDPPCSITTPGPGGSSGFSKPQRRSRTKLDSDAGLSPAGKNLNSPDCVQNLKGTGKILQGKSETNGNYLQGTRSIQDQQGQDGPRKRRPVTVDTSKAKTSLEALKLSIKQLKWKEIRLGKENETAVTPTFIVKPDGGSQGDGIYLIRDPSDLKLVVGSQAKQAVVQEYIPKPLLIDKLKFDIRLYVLIRSLEPLEIYIAKEGLTRFCTEPYQEPSQKNL
ncbi:tubulin polyglutamylase TTLL11, partial [Austrofundulus limnaeus]|uniref:Tubulin polyglutamylase TTLL11 n=1 Tax=Austrofundulus limnaeus TaxID=52670 RepID=A0A2I4D1Y0_AUSLI